MTVALVLAGALATSAVLVVALPFLRDPDPIVDVVADHDPAERERLVLLEQRDRALSALKELEADHRARRVSDDDYRSLVGPLRREAALTLRALDSDVGQEQPIRS